ncbi:hypothetical protein AVEN_84820-1 [Araneus ventricosus]|uniref:Uncharacterized protein n=1 Tax=Araneus ventricosus TaxID=182803 RepID=A0A4Y2IWU9_ARAVE|nr:hypothetical protein AVEN_84820-1 [Araneus ventricosus]
MQSFFPDCSNRHNWDKCFFENVSRVIRRNGDIICELNKELSQLATLFGITTDLKLENLSKHVADYLKKINGLPANTWVELCTLLKMNNPEDITERVLTLVESSAITITEYCDKSSEVLRLPCSNPVDPQENEELEKYKQEISHLQNQLQL